MRKNIFYILMMMILLLLIIVLLIKKKNIDMIASTRKGRGGRLCPPIRNIRLHKIWNNQAITC